jgi:hypothetical protein
MRNGGLRMAYFVAFNVKYQISNDKWKMKPFAFS